jgi:hypothetical protein
MKRKLMLLFAVTYAARRLAIENMLLFYYSQSVLDYRQYYYYAMKK